MFKRTLNISHFHVNMETIKKLEDLETTENTRSSDMLTEEEIFQALLYFYTTSTTDFWTPLFLSVVLILLVFCVVSRIVLKCVDAN